jgi:hypothetical protein
MGSSVPENTAALIRKLPCIRHYAQGQPIAVPETLVIIQARDEGTTA